MRILLVFLFVFSLSDVFSQDVHLSQFYNSDHFLNPAKVGDYDGDFRATLDYRNQWRQIDKQPISTYMLSFDHMFMIKRHEFDAGIFAVSDRFSGSEFNVISNSNVDYFVNNTKLLATIATDYYLKENKFRFGIQAGMAMSATDPQNQSYDNQWVYVLGDFDKLLSSKEVINISMKRYFDLNIGVEWSRKMGSFEPKIGFSLHHVNRPKESFWDNSTERLRARKVFFAETYYQISQKYSLHPKFLMMWTTKTNDMVLGANVSMKLDDKTIPFVYGGLHYRHGVVRIFDAIIPTIGTKYKKIDVALSYDINLSSLSKNTYSNRKGSFELSLIYTGASTLPKKLLIPCERY
jgi:type IX secretion system PorP/SprF family membrane protein